MYIISIYILHKQFQRTHFGRKGWILVLWGQIPLRVSFLCLNHLLLKKPEESLRPLGFLSVSISQELQVPRKELCLGGVTLKQRLHTLELGPGLASKVLPLLHWTVSFSSYLWVPIFKWGLLWSVLNNCSLNWMYIELEKRNPKIYIQHFHLLLFSISLWRKRKEGSLVSFPPVGLAHGWLSEPMWRHQHLSSPWEVFSGTGWDLLRTCSHPGLLRPGDLVSPNQFWIVAE